jgi:hypothetical protein
MAHVDKYNQIVGSDFSSKVRALVNVKGISGEANLYAPIIEGNT